MSDDKIYLSDDSPKKAAKPKGGKLSFFVILLALGAFFISPAPDYLISLIPDNLVKEVISPIYQEVNLSEKLEHLDQPQKYTSAEQMNILSHNSGICFMFKKENVSDKILKLAFHGKEIAEIIAISPNNKEYTLDNVTLDESENSAVICQKFGLRYSLTPDQIKSIYVRPLSPLTPYKIKWATMKNLR